MRALRYIAAVIAVLFAGWTLLAYHGLRTSAEDQARGWVTYPMPSHATLMTTTYLFLGAVLVCLSAWLMRPRENGVGGEVRTLAAVLWRSYLFRLGFSIVCALLAAVVIAFFVMAYLDSH